VRRSRIQARHLYISARKRGSLGHAGKLAYPTKPLNVESLHRSIRTHKEQGNHPARVIVDIQFPCDRMPPAGSMRGGKSSHARNRVGSTAGAPCQFTWEIIVKWKRDRRNGWVGRHHPGRCEVNGLGSGIDKADGTTSCPISFESNPSSELASELGSSGRLALNPVLTLQLRAAQRGQR